MGGQGIVVQPGEGLVSHSSTIAGRSYALKLLGGATDDSIMMFEETVPAGTKSTFHLHHDSDEVAYVLAGEITFMIGDEVAVAETGRVLFPYTPAKAGGLLEEQHRTQRGFSAMSEAELADVLQRHGWEIVGPSPL